MGSEFLPIPLILEETLAGRSRFSLNSTALSFLPSKSQFLHVISIAGSQSSGKSTLANHAFSLNFPMMVPSNTGQTTRGIDLQFTNRYICLDMEGSDSAERHAEDNAYIERMICAFGLVVSNLLIYNITIKDIRNIREVDYIANMMTHYLRICNEKRRILFCIRDVVEGFHDLEDIKTKISQTFNEAWNKAKAISNNQTLESVFEMDMITCSKYEEGERRFVNEDEIMTRFRDKVEEKLQDLNPFEVRSLTRLCSELWNRIETIKFEQLVSWEQLRKGLVVKCNFLACDMSLNGEYIDQLDDYNDQISNKIREDYAHDEYDKQALLKLWEQEFAKQAIYLEVEYFKISIRNYFYICSEKTKSLYKDLISIYKKIDIGDSDRNRIVKSEYKILLHESAKEQYLYKDTIHKSLNSIHSISYERINHYLAQLNKADTTKINFQSDLSNHNKGHFAVFSGIDAVLAMIELGFVAAEDSTKVAAEDASGNWKIVSIAEKAKKAKKELVSAVSAVATLESWAKVSRIMIAGTVLLGFIGAATCVGVMASWTRKAAWKDLAKEVRRFILDSDLFPSTYSDLENILKISDRSSS